MINEYLEKVRSYLVESYNSVTGAIYALSPQPVLAGVNGRLVESDLEASDLPIILKRNKHKGKSKEERKSSNRRNRKRGNGKH